MVSFYTHGLKLKNVLKDFDVVVDLQEIVNKYYHGQLLDLIFALYMSYCPELLESIFSYSHPYLSRNQYSLSEFEKALGKIGPSIYQLSISKDYCAEVHVDDNKTDFTLCYTSHPDDSISPINLLFLEYKLRLSIKNNRLFAFCSDIVHETGYRSPTTNPTYVGAITVNKQLDNLLEKQKYNYMRKYEMDIF